MTQKNRIEQNRNSTDYWTLTILGDVQICVAKEIQQMSTYVLLEQEDWFEDEIKFIRKFVSSNMSVLDVGANHGVYALSIATLLDSGHVWAFEPTRTPAEKLRASIEINELGDRITLVRAGLSDQNRSALINTSFNSELNSLHGNSKLKEEITLLSLDEYIFSQKIENNFSFVKLDAEGEEVNVVKGAARFFNEQSPLVMFELKHNQEINYELISLFRSLGYDIYRLLPDINILYEYFDSFTDGYLLNLFACKADMAQYLMSRNLLTTADKVNELLVSEPKIISNWQEVMQSFAYLLPEDPYWPGSSRKVPVSYRNALAASLEAHKSDYTSTARVAFLAYALQAVEKLIAAEEQHDLALLLLRLHLLNLTGFRSVAVTQAITIRDKLNANQHPTLPFLPPLQADFTRGVKGELKSWLLCCVLEFIERRRHFSSYFDPNGSLRLANQLVDNPNHSIFAERLAVLSAKRLGLSVYKPSVVSLLDSNRSKNFKAWESILSSN